MKMNESAFIFLTLLFRLQNAVASGQSTHLTESNTKPTNQYNPLEHLLLNQNENHQVDGPRVKRELNEQSTNPPYKVSSQSNIEKIPPNNANNNFSDMILHSKGNEGDSSSKAAVRVKRQYYPYPPYYRRPYYPVPIIIGGGGFPLGGFGGRGFGGRGFGGRGFGGRGFGGRGIGGRGGLGGRGGAGGGHGGGRG